MSNEATFPKAAAMAIDPMAVWKPQTEAVLSFYGRAMTLAENNVRRQADLLHELGAAKTPTEIVAVQTRFLQEFWASAMSDGLKAFAAYRGTDGAAAPS